MKLFNLILLIGISNINYCQTKTFSSFKAIKLGKTEQYLLPNSDSCKCLKKIYVIDKTIFLEDIYPDQPCRVEYSFEKKSDCRKLGLTLGKKYVDLDSLYISKCLNKETIYIPGFIQGKFVLKKNIIYIYLEYLNEAINSSETTTHTYYLEYDKKTEKLKKLKLSFDK